MARRIRRTVRSTSTATHQADPPQKTLGDLLFACPEAPHISEQEWVDIVRAIAAGDPTALRAIYDRTHRLAFTLIMRMTHDRAMSEELTIDVYHEVWRRAASYDPANGTVLGWIMHQARSRVLDRAGKAAP
jgi:hypothetical protein